MDNYQHLANAIIEQAVLDYRKALRSKDKTWGGENIRTIRKFFISKWFTYLTDVDGKWLVDRLNQEV